MAEPPFVRTSVPRRFWFVKLSNHGPTYIHIKRCLFLSISRSETVYNLLTSMAECAMIAFARLKGYGLRTDSGKIGYAIL